MRNFTKVFFVSGLLLLTVISKSQSGAKWSTGLNGIGNGDAFGTSNNFPILFFTNGSQRMSLGTNGVLNLSSLSGSGNRILLSDATGNISALSQGGNNQFLRGDGIWSTLAASSFLQSGNDIYLPNGSIGIGIPPSPGIKLDVVGNARVSNNLYVGGGIVITDKVQAATQIKGFDFKVDNDLAVDGNSKFLGAVTATQGISLDNNNTLGINFRQGVSPNTGTFNIGPLSKILPANCASVPQSPYNIAVGGVVQIYDAANANNTGLLNLQTWSNGCSIDASTSGMFSGGLLINYFCGSNTFINTGTPGGTVFLGHTVVNGKKSVSHPSAEFMVNGTAVCKELYVTKPADWPDYVFKPEYKLPSLLEVETFYKAHHHLPTVPSEQELEKNDVNIVEMNAILLRKIEELTLYSVELYKELNQVKNELKILKQQK